jgi:hypothetical protein
MTLLPVEAALAQRAIDTQVKFGEQAERPPIFQHVPRGGDKKRHFHQMQSSNDAALEALRLQAQNQYARIKAQRKQSGRAFHL